MCSFTESPLHVCIKEGGLTSLTLGCNACRVVSAPGKVLITGAYLVLEKPHAGLVLSTSARFYAIVKPIHAAPAPDSWSWVHPLLCFLELPSYRN